MAKIQYINAMGGGFNKSLDVPDGQTIERLVEEQMRGESRANLNISINGFQATAQQVLREGDVVSIIPGKYEGGAGGIASFAQNLKAAAELGRLVSEDPELIPNLASLGGLAEVFTPAVIKDFTAVTELGKALRADPELVDHFTAVTELGKALRADPELVDNVHAAVSLVNAIRSLDSSCGPVAPGHPHEDQPAIPAVPKADVGENQVSLLTGRGLAQPVNFTPGENILAFFQRVKQGSYPDEYRILVNGLTVVQDYQLKTGDHVSIRLVAELSRR